MLLAGAGLPVAEGQKPSLVAYRLGGEVHRPESVPVIGLMSSVDDRPATARRPRDAEASRQALLDAARLTFDELGYDRATTREIGERAGVDPALIARYFESKEGLFLAAITAGVGGGRRHRLRAARAARLPARTLGRARPQPDQPRPRQPGADPRGPHPGRRRGRRPRRSPVWSPSSRARDVAEPELRAELLVALAVGVAMTRANGTLEALAAAPRERRPGGARPARLRARAR